MKRKVIVLSYCFLCTVFILATFVCVRYICFDRPRELSLKEEEALLIQPDQVPGETAGEDPEPEDQAAEDQDPEPEDRDPAPEDPDPAETQAPERVTLYCWGNHVNVRTGPGTSYPAIGQLNRGQSIQAEEESESWTKVVYGNRQAYISARFLRQEAPARQESPRRSLPDTGDPIEKKKQAEASRPEPEQPEQAEPPREEAPEQVLQEPPAPDYEAVDETVYCLGDSVNLRETPEGKVLSRLSLGQSLHRTGIGSNGWSRVEVQGREAYVSARYLSREPVPAEPEQEEFSRPGPNSPFLYRYVKPDRGLPYGIFLPRDYDGSRTLPLLISLHGAGERGKSRACFESKFLVNAFLHWEDTGLAPIEAVIVCPHLSGSGYSSSWNNSTSASRLFALIEQIRSSFSIDRVILQGQSMGAQGVLYMGADSRACFSALVPISAYAPGRDYTGITAPIRGYSGSPYLPGHREDRNSYTFMESAFTRVFGTENWFVRECSHDEIPLTAFLEDRNGDGSSDLVDWMLSQ